MINEERFWESAVAEAVRGDTPPDVTSRVLAGLAEPEAQAQPELKPRRRLRLIRVFAELAVAAAVVFAIAWLTGLIRMPESGDGGDDGEKLEIAAAPETDYEVVDGKIELQQGWLLVVTGTPSVSCHGSLLEQVDGRVLVHASGVPTREQAEAVLGWLNANRLGQDMVGELTRWVQGVGMAALVLSGSALLDGERIQAQEEVKADPARWYTVRTVMDIDKLPADARLVRGEDVRGAHLEFLASHESIEAIDFSGCTELRPEHIGSLSTMKNLRILELRDASWDGDPDYQQLRDLPALKELAIDYMPTKGYMEGPYPPENWEDAFHVTSALGNLSDRGVLITLGALSEIGGVQLARIASNIETLRELSLRGNTKVTDADMKALADHKSLRALDLTNCAGVTELGLAYFAKQNRLASLKFNAELTDAIAYQLTRMTNLERLELPDGLAQSIFGLDEEIGPKVQKVFEQFATLQKLKHLSWNLAPYSTAANYAPLTKLKQLESLSLWDMSDGEQVLLALEVALAVPVKTLELVAYEHVLIGDPDLPGEDGAARLAKIASNSTVQELRVALRPSAMLDSTDEPGILPSLVAKFPGLKRITLEVPFADSVEHYSAYAARHLGAYTVDVVAR